MDKDKRKFVSIKDCKLIGKGFHGEVYKLNDEQIIKVYCDNSQLSDIEKERKLSRASLISGIQCAITFELVDTEKGYGVIFELAGAKSLSKCIEDHPDQLEEYAEKYAELMIDLNNREADTGVFPSVKEMHINTIRNMPGWLYSKKQIEALVKVVESVPDATTFVHTDYHPNNVLIDEKGELILIDLADIGYGNPLFDMANTYLLLVYACKTDGQKCKAITGLSQDNCKKVADLLMKKYFNSTDDKVLQKYFEACEYYMYIKMLLNSGMTLKMSVLEKFIISIMVKQKILKHREECINSFKVFENFKPGK